MKEEFYKLPIIGILRGIQEDDIPVVFEAAIEAGLPAIEITMNTKNTFNLISIAEKAYSSQIQIGTGTVLDIASAKKAVDTGASFIVSPCNPPEVAEFCSSYNIPYFPGALTPQEIWNAWESGAKMVKVFPANIFGSKYFKDVKGPLDSVKLLACGGVSADTITDFCKNGADGFAFGSSIFKTEWIKDKNKNGIRDSIQKLIKKYTEFIGKSV